MSRLYYPPELRLSSTAQLDLEEAGKKVAKLIPSELITAYLALVSLTFNVKLEWLHPWLFVASFLFCLVMTPIYLNRMADKGKPKRNHLIVSSVAFVVWAYFVSGKQIMLDLSDAGLASMATYDAGLASMATVAFSVVSAVVPLDK